MTKFNLDCIQEEMANLENSLYLLEKKHIDRYAEERIKIKSWEEIDYEASTEASAQESLK